jgi:hypothetical protein
MDPYEEIDKIESLQGDWRVEILFPVNLLISWLKQEKKKQAETEWVYDGCNCIPEEKYLSVPYCEEHYNPLIRIAREV